MPEFDFRRLIELPMSKSMVFAIIKLNDKEKEDLKKFASKPLEFKKKSTLFDVLSIINAELKLKHQYGFNVELLVDVIRNLQKIDIFGDGLILHYSDKEVLPLIISDGDNAVVLAPKVDVD